MQTEWKIDLSRVVNRHQFKTLSRRYGEEVQSCLQNLGRVIDELKTGKPLSSVAFPFFRPEGDGVFRIGQTGVFSAREMRLYVAFVFVQGVAYLLSIGTKNTQTRDIADARRAARQLKKESP
jgi:hypothetical protein